MTLHAISTPVTRRGFVEGAAAMGVLAGAVGLAGQARADETVEQFDEEYDVVVLGMGGAGMNAAISAWEEGAKVLLSEKAPEGVEPCNTKVSGQVILSTDDPDAFYTYLKQIMGFYTNYDDEALRVYADEAALNWDWMMNVLGGDPEVTFPREEPDFKSPGGLHYVPREGFFDQDRPGYALIWDEYSEFEGSEHAVTLSFTGHDFDGAYYAKLRENIAQREGDNLTIWYDAPGKELITDAQGSVTGVVIEKSGKPVRIKANGGVILATGGFEANPVMISDYAQVPYLYPRAGAMNTGDGLVMAQKVGAQLWHMANLSGLDFAYHPGDSINSVYLGGSLGGVRSAAIFVGAGGGRFMNEKARSRHGRIGYGGSWSLMTTPTPAYVVTDSTQIGLCKLATGFSDDNSREIADGTITSGETIEELAANIRALGKAPAFNLEGQLEDALAHYNAHCHANDGAGEVDDFGRECTVPLETPPFYALEICPTIVNTQGGPRRNAQCQIINLDSMPIEGLFSAGELGSIFADMYNGGGNLGETMIWGRVAGRNAAHRAQGSFVGSGRSRLVAEDVADAKAVEAQAEAEANAAAAQVAADAVYADGTYEATGKGLGGDVPVTVVIENGKIASVEVGENSETQGIGSKAIEQLPALIVESNGTAGVDAVSGASVTSKAIFDAVEEILAQA